MVMYTNNDLHIIIKGGDPQAQREKLLKALSAVVRWFSSSKNEHYDKDDANLFTVGELIEELTIDEDHHS